MLFGQIAHVTAGTGKISENLEHLVMPERKEVIKKTKMMGTMLKNKGANLKEFSMAKSRPKRVTKSTRLVLDYNQ